MQPIHPVLLSLLAITDIGEILPIIPAKPVDQIMPWPITAIVLLNLLAQQIIGEILPPKIVNLVQLRVITPKSIIAPASHHLLYAVMES